MTQTRVLRDIPSCPYHVSVILGIVANHVAECSWHVGAWNGLDVEDVLVCLAENLGGICLARGVDPLVKGSQDDLSQIEAAGIGTAGSYQLIQKFLGNGRTILERTKKESERSMIERVKYCDMGNNLVVAGHF